MATRLSSIHTLSRIDFPQQLAAYPELEPFLLKGVRQTAECKRLGNGSFGVVDELYVQGTLCAAKQLHSSLLDPRTQGVDRVISRFVEECRIMTSVRHPNIVQFLGLHIFTNATHPTLVMEKLAMSLEDLLDESNKKKEDIPLSLKVSILSDTAKGLVYLHNHKPQIIHRDLTTRNILLTLAMQAKITDLGNALIIDSDTVAMTMTQTPGTAVYMPPEAVHTRARYDSTIDMFSYGHLALYTIIQEFPRDLLPATYMEESKRQLCARSEIERREKYISVLHQKLGKRHLLTHIIERCLDNMTDERPSALQVLENLEEMSKTVKNSQDDFYHDYQHMSKLDLVKMLDGTSTHKSRVESVASLSPYVSIGPEGKTAHEYLQLVGENSPPNTTTNFMPDQSAEKIKVGVPGKLTLSKGGGTGSLRRSRSLRGRGTVNKKEYTFKISTTSHSTASLVYYEEKAKGEVKLSDIVDVSASSQDKSKCDNSFEITVKGKEGKLKLTASSKDERDSWVKALTQLISPDIASMQHPHQQIVTSPHVHVQQRGNQSVSPNRGEGTDFPKMQNNRAYGYLPPQPTTASTVATAFASDKTKIPALPPAVTVPDSSYYVIEKAFVSDDPEPRAKEAGHYRDEPKPRPLSQESDPGYDYIQDTVPEPSPEPVSTYSTTGTLTKNNSTVVVSTKLNPELSSMDRLREEEYTLMQSVGFLQPISSRSSDPTLPSPESPMGVSKTLNRLSRFNSDQMEHLIDMLRRTVATQPQNGKGPIPEQTAAVRAVTTPPPRPPKPDPAISKASSGSAASLTNFRQRPSQLSLSTDSMNGDSIMHGSREHSVYVNTVPLASEKENGKGDKGEGEREGISVPTLVVESTDHEESAPPMQRRKSAGLLNTTETANAIKFKLARLLSETDGTSKSSLLVTGDSPEAYEERPDWAKASTGTTPVHSPLPKDDPLSLLRKQALFMRRSALKDLQEIGEGQFGKVYKASLVRSRSEDMTVAVKTIKQYKSEQETSDFLHEMGVMMDLMHPNIIHLYGIVQQESPWLVLQYLPNGDLKNYLIRNERSVDQLIKYMIDVAMGMHYIMERGLVHRDLAARNVMVDDRETCKVADFGLLREIPKDNTIYQATTELPWPIRWMAPESLDNREFSPATDVWSFGVLLWEMYYPNQLPYAELSNVQVPTRIMTGHRLSIPLAYPSIVESIMKACWQKKPGKRPSFLLISTLLTNMTVQIQA